MIERSVGITTGTGYLVGDGYKGKTNELDTAVVEISKLMEDTFKKDIEIRFNHDRESGGAFIKDNAFSCKIGIGVRLASSKYLAMSRQEKDNLSALDIRKLPNDVMFYHVVIDKNLIKEFNEKDRYKDFNSLDDAYDWLSENMNMTEVQKYLNDLGKETPK